MARSLNGEGAEEGDGRLESQGVFRIECIAAQIECYGSNLFTLAKSTASFHSWPHSKSIRSALGKLNAVGG
ncbi:hypothetical protein I3843_05G106200 [Carya illinoinensis]|nr:hypothetical protein I3843_05G106200 [Carya illinoinensis]